MATTPEGKVKRKVKAVLKKYASYQLWPVQCGYGVSTLDCLACVNGLFIGIETKAPGKYPTPRQEATIREMQDAGGITRVISTPEEVEELDTLCQLLCSLENKHGAHSGTT